MRRVIGEISTGGSDSLRWGDQFARKLIRFLASKIYPNAKIIKLGGDSGSGWELCHCGVAIDTFFATVPTQSEGFVEVIILREEKHEIRIGNRPRMHSGDPEKFAHKPFAEFFGQQ